MKRGPSGARRSAGCLFSLALTSFLTGVTEPIEFTFMFVAPLLYAIHALLTGASMALMNALDVKLGFGFSAGLFDYVLNFSLATRPWLLLPVGAVYAALYYGLFRFFIRRFDLATPGREPLVEGVGDATRADVVPAGVSGVKAKGGAAGGGRAAEFVTALGGAANLRSVAACTTRLRLVIVDRVKVDEPALGALGARGVIYPSAADLQVILGPIADAVADEIRSELERSATPGAPASDGFEDLLASLGGRANILSVERRASRLCLTIGDESVVDRARLERSGLRGVVSTGPNAVQLIVGPDAGTVMSDFDRLV
jgi:PTS system N-acetylglucosamine-specific IIC component